MLLVARRKPVFFIITCIFDASGETSYGVCKQKRPSLLKSPSSVRLLIVAKDFFGISMNFTDYDALFYLVFSGVM